MEKQCSICGSLTTNKKIIDKEIISPTHKTVVSIEVRRYQAFEDDGVISYSQVPERLDVCDTCLDNLINE